MSATAPAPVREHSAALDALRVFGALAVFVKHSSLATGQQLRPGYGWMNHFEIGPTIFFVLSAFLVYRPFVRALARREPASSARSFLVRRAVRIIPLYWLALVVLFAFDHQGSDGIGIKIGGVRGALELATFTHIYDPARFFNGIAAAYTLDVEVSFYVFVVVWVVVVHRWAARSDRPLRVVGRGLGALFAVNLLWRLAVGHWLRPDDTVCSATQTHWTCAAVNWLPGFLDYFVLGMALALLAVHWEQTGEIAAGMRRALRWPIVWIVAAVGCFWLYSARYGTIGLNSLTGVDAEIRHELSGVIVALLVIPAVFVPLGSGPVSKALRSPVVRWGAVFSYGFYLWHQGWLDAALKVTGARQFHGNFAVVAVLAMFYAVLTAAFTWWVIERPLRNWMARR